ncbi:MAG: hypothetical protein KY461_14990 [Actinobacteria bacterium]|nr:hypothetical protein [Actinomycetota bacterium]
MPIDAQTAHALEVALAGVPGVLGAVVLDDVNDAAVLEVQAFVRETADVTELRTVLARVAAEVTDRPVEVVPLAIAAPASPPVPSTDPVGPAPAGPRGRPRLVSVVLDSSLTSARHEAYVSLQDTEVAAGRATVGRDPLIAVVAAACHALTRDGQEAPTPRAVERFSFDGLEVMVVAVTVRGRTLVGSALLEDEPEPAAVVRATLDAVNRWYGLG